MAWKLNVYKKCILVIDMEKMVSRTSPEKVIMKFQNSRKLYIPFYAMCIFLLLFIIYVKYTGRPLNDNALKLSLTFIVVVVLATEIHRFGESYVFTNKSIILNSGYFSILSKRIEFEAISDIHVRQGPWQRLLKFGDVQLFKFAPGPILKNINRPDEFSSRLEDIIVKAKAGVHEE